MLVRLTLLRGVIIIFYTKKNKTKDNLNTISKIIWTRPRNLAIEDRMEIRNITENITRSTALQQETFTTQFHQLFQNNQGNINNFGNKTFLWGETEVFLRNVSPHS